MANIALEKLETMVEGLGKSFFAEKTFFEQVWMLFIVAFCAQLYCQYISFESEVEWIAVNLMGGAAPSFGTYAMAICFELVKAKAVITAIKNFLISTPANPVPAYKIVLPALFGIGLSYASWWMSDKGTIYMAEAQAGVAPTDTRTSEINSIFSPQISKIDARIDEIESKNFYWCAEHNLAHKCPTAGYHVSKAKEDKAALKEVEQLNAQKTALLSNMNTQMAQATNQHATAVSSFEAKRASLHVSLENKILWAELLTWACLMFTSFIYYRVTHKTDTDAVPKKTERTDDVPNPKRKNTDAVYSEEDMAEAQKEVERFATESRALREELAATKEALLSGSQKDEAKI